MSTLSRLLEFKCHCCLLIDVYVSQHPERKESSSDTHMSILPGISLLVLDKSLVCLQLFKHEITAVAEKALSVCCYNVNKK